MKVLDIQQAINMLINKANLKDRSAIAELGQLVMDNQELINRALICYRQCQNQ